MTQSTSSSELDPQPSTQRVDDSVLEHFRREWRAEVERKTGQHKDEQETSVPETKDISKGKKVIQNQPLKHLGVSNEVDHWEHKKDVIEDVTGSSQNSPQSALDLYIRAITLEREGNLGEALKYYQQAFRLDRHIDYTYTKHYNDAMSGKEGSSNSAITKHFTQINHDEMTWQKSKHSSSQQHNDDLLSALINSFRSMNLEYAPLQPQKSIPIAKLPNELLLCILKRLILVEIASVERFSLVCKRFFLLSRENAVWKFLCGKTYRIRGVKETLSNSLLEKQVKLYGNDWRRMFIERPRIRYDGVYISTCRYLRPGLSENTWNQCIHIVTYYRFLRFYPDGTCLKLQSSYEPKSIVKGLERDNKLPDLFIGLWKLDENNQVSITLDDPNPRKQASRHLKFDLRSTHRGKHNKLAWISYHSFNQLNGEESDFNLRNEKNFFFSKVKSYQFDWDFNDDLYYDK